jgi:hypothetical protein
MMTKLYNLDGIVYYTSKLSPNLYCQKNGSNINVLKLILKNTENTNLADRFQIPPVFYSSKLSNFEITKYLIENNNADIYSALDGCFNSKKFKKVILLNVVNSLCF